MSNTYFQFKQFIVHQQHCAMKVCTDSCLFGAWSAQYAKNKNRILDIGAGTGLLMLMLAQQTTCDIDGIEIEPGCYQQLSQNLSISSWAQRLSAISGDVRTFPFTEQYDFIISNPPFFRSDLLSGSETNRLARHSTELSLHELFSVTSRLLTADGTFVLLLPFHRLLEINEVSRLTGLSIFEQVIISQSDTHQPFRVFTRLGKWPIPALQTSKLSIKTGKTYTPEFVSFLREYYLNV